MAVPDVSVLWPCDSNCFSNTRYLKTVHGNYRVYTFCSKSSNLVHPIHSGLPRFTRNFYASSIIQVVQTHVLGNLFSVDADFLIFKEIRALEGCLLSKDPCFMSS